jgi:acyl-CoA thioesterase FadM
MTRWIRFLLTMARAFFSPKIDPMKESRLKFRAWFTDADLSVVNNASILSYTEVGRIDFLVRSGLMSLCLKEKIYTAVATTHLNFRRPLRRFSLLELCSRIIYWDSKWIWIEQKIYFQAKGERKLAASVVVKVTFKKGKNFIPFDELLRQVGINIESLTKPVLVQKLEETDELALMEDR